jgi:hypothetical protein
MDMSERSYLGTVNNGENVRLQYSFSSGESSNHLNAIRPLKIVQFVAKLCRKIIGLADFSVLSVSPTQQATKDALACEKKLLLDKSGGTPGVFKHCSVVSSFLSLELRRVRVLLLIVFW